MAVIKGLQNVIDAISGDVTKVYGEAVGAKETIERHAADAANPHSVTAAQAGLGNVDNTSDADKPVSTAQAAAIAAAMGQEAETRAVADAGLQAQIDLGHGKGGALTAHDFGTETPTQAEFIEYACADIWGEGGEFTFDADNPEESTYRFGEPDNGITYTASEIFNNTWVRNLYNGENHKWVLTNTQDTEPAVYIWTDVGQDVVMGATDAYAGVAKLYNDYDEANTDGSVTQAAVHSLAAELTGVVEDITGVSYEPVYTQ